MDDPSPLVDDTNRRIVQMLADGYSAQQLAAELFMVGSTVDRRLRTLRAQAGANTTTHLVAIALRRGWIA